MRRTIFMSVILFFFCSIFAYAQHIQPTLVGTWQYYHVKYNEDGTSEQESWPIFKKITVDGKFYQLKQTDGIFRYSHEGTCYLKDDLYMEYITRHAFDKKMIGTTSKIHYYFINENMVNFSFNIGKNYFFEVWMRVPDDIDLSRVVKPAGY